MSGDEPTQPAKEKKLEEEVTSSSGGVVAVEKESKKQETDVKKSDEVVVAEEQELGIIEEVKVGYTKMRKVVFKYFDDRGFGRWDDFITWLAIPFIGSMVIWYFAMQEMWKMSAWDMNEQEVDGLPPVQREL